jgi:hypothetical protein
MKKNQYPESLLLMVELNQFFRVKATGVIQDENEINKSGKSMPATYVYQKHRKAKNKREDFEEIFEREFSNSGLEDNVESKKYYRTVLAEELQCKLSSYIHSTKDKPQKGRSHRLILITENFIKYLSEPIAPQNKSSENMVDNNEEEEKSPIQMYLSRLKKNNPRNYQKMLSQENYEKLVNWVNSYFENDLKVPEIKKPIIKTYASQQIIVNTFTELFKELRPSIIMPDSLFELIKKCFHEYREKKIKNLRKANKKQNYY